jgi:ribose/xylose/arabinose/galactoside ABC-type transport system permease subunit
VAGTLIGALLLTVVLNGMNFCRSFVVAILAGIIILLAVWIDSRTRRSDA